MADLPEEVLVDILLRLPVESLLRFKCVRKSWNALIKNPKFISKHTINQSKKDVILKRACPDNGHVLYLLSVIDDGGGDNDDDISCIVDLNLDIQLPYSIMHGHCDGIIALSDFDEEIILCNPAIKEVRTLPKSSFHPFPQNPDGYNFPTGLPNPMHAETAGVGFGYDSKSTDYKIVRVVNFLLGASSNFELPSRAEVFSLGADSTWREINNVVVSEARIILNYDMEQYFDGVYYWCINRLEVLSFDMGDVFRKAPMPDACTNNNEWQLGVFNNESIAMFVYPYKGVEKCIDVWVMKELGSWTKQLSIGSLPLPEDQRPLVLWNNCKELLQEDVDAQLVSFNLVTLKSKNFHIHGVLTRGWQAIPLFPYMKTLVSVNKREDIAT